MKYLLKIFRDQKTMRTGDTYKKNIFGKTFNTLRPHYIFERNFPQIIKYTLYREYCDKRFSRIFPTYVVEVTYASYLILKF